MFCRRVREHQSNSMSRGDVLCIWAGFKDGENKQIPVVAAQALLGVPCRVLSYDLGQFYPPPQLCLVQSIVALASRLSSTPFATNQHTKPSAHVIILLGPFAVVVCFIPYRRSHVDFCNYQRFYLCRKSPFARSPNLIITDRSSQNGNWSFGARGANAIGPGRGGGTPPQRAANRGL